MIEKFTGTTSLIMAIILAYFDISALVVLSLVAAGIIFLTGDL